MHWVVFLGPSSLFWCRGQHRVAFSQSWLGLNLSGLPHPCLVLMTTMNLRRVTIPQVPGKPDSGLRIGAWSLVLQLSTNLTVLSLYLTPNQTSSMASHNKPPPPSQSLNSLYFPPPSLLQAGPKLESSLIQLTIVPPHCFPLWSTEKPMGLTKIPFWSGILLNNSVNILSNSVSIPMAFLIAYTFCFKIM